MVFTFSELKQSKLANAPHFLVVGNPISHSLSPMMHQLGLNHYDIQASYHALKLEHHEITGFIAWMNRDSFLGCNITIPFKELFTGLLDESDDTVSETGAVNTITKSGGLLKGFNTDVEGFLKPLWEYEEILYDNRAVVFGTGGASKAVLSALRRIGVGEVIFVSRNPAQSNRTTHIETDEILIHYCGYEQVEAYAEDAILFVNCTPLGMMPNTQASPVDRMDTGILADKICYDLVYNPLETRFLSLARSQDAVTINGLEMFIAQGDMAFKLWTNKNLPYERIYDLLTKQLQVK